MIYIAGDKHGYKVRQIVEEYLQQANLEYTNLGVTNASDDLKLEVMIPRVTTKVLADVNTVGILTCGTGIGVEVGANKFGGIRACLATNEKLAEWSKTFDNCNVLCLVGWEADKNRIWRILDSWFKSQYNGDEQQSNMIEEFDKWH